jgi:tyrosinase
MNNMMRLLLVVTALIWGIGSASAQERIRKSIDALTADELENYIHAVKKIRDKSTTDPSVEFSYAHMAGLHNIPALFDGACMHHTYHFLAWHRAHLINYEDALRASDPPRTSNVTIPYWDWSKAPTGKRYPVAFENDAAAVATHYGRPIDPALLPLLANTRRNSAASAPLYPWKHIAGIAKLNTEGFLGMASGPSGFEAPPHDTLHGFVGGDLCCPWTAADDVIFWSFHTFFDVVWWWRQQTITDAIPCQDCVLDGMKAKTALRTDGPTLVKHVTNAKDQLGYTYQFTPDTSTPTPMAAGPTAQVAQTVQTISQELPVLANLALRPPTLTRRFEVGLPSGATDKVAVALEQAAAPADVAYLGFVYLHPASQPFDAASVEFRDRYLVAQFGQWATHHARAGHRDNRELRFPIDLSAYPSIKSASGPLVLTVAIHLQAKAGGPTPMASATAHSPTELERNTKIGSASLRVR